MNIRLLLVPLVAGIGLSAFADHVASELILSSRESPMSPVNKKGEDCDFRSTFPFRHGSPVWRYQIENTSDSPRVAHLVFQDDSYFHRQRQLDYLIEVPVGAKEVKAAELHLPFVGSIFHGGGYAASIDEGLAKPKTPVRVYGLSMESAPAQSTPCRFLDLYFDPLIVVAESVDAAISRAYSNAWNDEVQKQYHHRSNEMAVQCDVRTCDFARFTEWRDFSVASAVVVDAKTWTNLTDVARTALKGYVVAGGSLVLLGEGFPKDAPSDGVHGLGEVARLKKLDVDSSSENERFADLVANAARKLQLVRNNWSNPIPCGVASNAAIEAELGRTPFGTIVLVLAAFVLLAGPALVIYLARTNRRIHLLWLFPTIAIVFTAIVVIALIAREGVSPRIKHFTHTAADAEFGMSVMVEDTVIVAPIPMNHVIDLPADALVSFDGGDCHVRGETIVVDERGYHFFGPGWTPSLWPVRFRAVRVEGGTR